MTERLNYYYPLLNFTNDAKVQKVKKKFNFARRINKSKLEVRVPDL